MVPVLRWVAVFPAAVASSMLTGLAWQLFTAIFRSDDPSWVIMILTAAISAATFVYAGTHVAPSHRAYTAIALTALDALWALALFWLAAQADGQFLSMAVWVTASVAAAIATCVHLYGEFPPQGRARTH